MRAFFLCLVDAGLRRDDARLLAWDRIHDGAIFLYQQKSGAGLFIPMTTELAQTIGSLVKNGQYVFTTEQGRPYSVSTITRAWSTAKRIAGIKRAFRLHDLRHTTASGLIQAGVPLAEVALSLTTRNRRKMAITS